MEKEEKLLTEDIGMRNKKVLVFGIDGGTFDLLNPWMERGLLPNLKKIKEEGVSGILKSSLPPVTGPAWISFMTGKNPGKHGIYEFLVRKPHSYEEMPVNSNYRDGQTLWEILSSQGYKVGVLNVPLTYPPQKVNGILISGFLTPGDKRDFIYPPELVDEIERKFGRYYLHMRSLDIVTILSDNYIASFLQDCLSMMLYKFKVAKFLIEKRDFDFFMLHIWSTDRIQHVLWNILDTQHPYYRSDLAEKYYDEIVSFYRELDRQIGEIVAQYGSSANIFVISDHGFCKIKKSIDLNVWLLKEGYIKLKNDFTSRLKFFLWEKGLTYEWLYGRLGLRWGRLWGKLSDKLLVLILKNKFARPPMDVANDLFLNKKRWLLSLSDVDWSMTKAYCKIGLGQIYINLRGREPEGIVNAGEDYDNLRSEIIRKLKEFMNEVASNKVEIEIYAKEEIYHGDYFDEMPDITFLAHNNGYQAGSLMGFGSNRTIIDSALNQGHHNIDGILLAKGESLKDGINLDATSIMDITPTILYIMGCKIPEDMDGRVLKEIFKEAFMEQHPIEFVEPRKGKRKQRSEMSPQEQKEIIERLRNLGYID